MELRGNRDIAASRGQVIRALRDPEMIRAILPEIVAFTPTGPESYDLALQVKAGPVPIRLSGNYRLTGPAEKGAPLHLALELNGPLGASVAITLTLGIKQQSPYLTHFVHRGALVAGGILGKFAEEQKARVEAALNRRLDDFARQVEQAA